MLLQVCSLCDKFLTTNGLEPIVHDLYPVKIGIYRILLIAFSAVSGLVSYLPVADENLFRLEEGNDAYAKLALEFANAQVLLP